MKKTITFLLMLALASCKGTEPSKIVLNSEATAAFNSIPVLLKIVEDTAYVLNKSIVLRDVSTVKLNQVTITYSKNNYYLQQSLDSVIASSNGVEASTHKLVRTNWPDYLSLDSSLIKVKFRSKIVDNNHTIIADDCIENTLMQMKQNVLVKETKVCLD